MSQVVETNSRQARRFRYASEGSFDHVPVEVLSLLRAEHQLPLEVPVAAGRVLERLCLGWFGPILELPQFVFPSFSDVVKRFA